MNSLQITNSLQMTGEAQLQAYRTQHRVAQAIAAGTRHPIARLVAWASRVLARRPMAEGPSYKDYPFFK